MSAITWHCYRMRWALNDLNHPGPPAAGCSSSRDLSGPCFSMPAAQQTRYRHDLSCPGLGAPPRLSVEPLTAGWVDPRLRDSLCEAVTRDSAGLLSANGNSGVASDSGCANLANGTGVRGLRPSATPHHPAGFLHHSDLMVVGEL